jgi:hypothetical protein
MNRLKIVVPGAAWSDVFLDDAEKPLIPGAPRLMRSQKGPAVVHLLFPSYLSKQRGEVHEALLCHFCVTYLHSSMQAMQTIQTVQYTPFSRN